MKLHTYPSSDILNNPSTDQIHRYSHNKGQTAPRPSDEVSGEPEAKGNPRSPPPAAKHSMAILVHCCQTRWRTDIRRGPQHRRRRRQNRLRYRTRRLNLGQQGLVPSWTPPYRPSRRSRLQGIRNYHRQLRNRGYGVLRRGPWRTPPRDPPWESPSPARHRLPGKHASAPDPRPTTQRRRHSTVNDN